MPILVLIHVHFGLPPGGGANKPRTERPFATFIRSAISRLGEASVGTRPISAIGN